MHPEPSRAITLVSLLTLFALLVQGYHPYAEDGGLYVAGILKRLDPTLYVVNPEFVLAPLRFSPFADILAWTARTLHIPVPWLLLALYGASVWATLYGGWQIISRCTEDAAARAGAIALLACWLSIPIAGTSLMLMDPYVTTRSLSTPLTLFAIAWAMDALTGNRRAAILCALALLLAAIHPLMAAYAIATILVLALAKRPFALCGCAFSVAAAIQALASPESADYIRAALSRYYWFPTQWHWYEQAGLIAPLALLWALKRARIGRTLAHMAILLGSISLAVALTFAHAGFSTHLLARLQPLRCFQIVYEIMILLLGAWLGQHWLRRSAWRWTLLLALLGSIMFLAQRNTYPASNHFELPGQTPRNLWVQAFIWVRANTPQDALFALDAHYITHNGEDAQGFRAIAQRSALPDYSKDGGEASIMPDLAAAWATGQTAQTGLDAAGDEAREAALRPFGVTWVVLAATSITAWQCPYRNAAVMVCRLP